MQESSPAAPAAPETVPTSRRAVIALVLLLLACAAAFTLVAHDAGVGRPGGPAPARPTQAPTDAPRLVSEHEPPGNSTRLD